MPNQDPDPNDHILYDSFDMKFLRKANYRDRSRCVAARRYKETF